MVRYKKLKAKASSYMPRETNKYRGLNGSYRRNNGGSETNVERERDHDKDTRIQG